MGVLILMYSLVVYVALDSSEHISKKEAVECKRVTTIVKWNEIDSEVIAINTYAYDKAKKRKNEICKRGE
jgi:hypothetical protein